MSAQLAALKRKMKAGDFALTDDEFVFYVEQHSWRDRHSEQLAGAMIRSIKRGDRNAAYNLDVFKMHCHPDVAERRNATLRLCYRWNDQTQHAIIDQTDYPTSMQ
jgi:hypothetical protein